MCPVPFTTAAIKIRYSGARKIYENFISLPCRIAAGRSIYNPRLFNNSSGGAFHLKRN